MEKSEIKDDVITIKKTVILKVIKLLFYIYVLVFSIFVIVNESNQITKINEVSNKLDSISISSSSKSADTLEISAMAYYADYELNDLKELNALEQKGDYMIYFHSNDCQYCLEANVFLNQYITLGYQNITPIYFATYDKAPAIFDDEKFKIESTPTMVYYSSNDKSYSSYIGYEEIFNLVDSVVNSSK